MVSGLAAAYSLGAEYPFGGSDGEYEIAYRTLGGEVGEGEGEKETKKQKDKAHKKRAREGKAAFRRRVARSHGWFGLGVGRGWVRSGERGWGWGS